MALPGRLGIVTMNAGKFKEIKELLKGVGCELHQVDEPFIEIQADTLEEVVLYGLKEIHQRRSFSHPVIKDDSGLFIDILDGFPGVYSAHAMRTIGCEGMLRLMEGQPERRAEFRTSVGLLYPDGSVSIYRGFVRGRIVEEARGRQGFGFDPIFVPEGHDETFSEMDLGTKNGISHRSRAISSLVNDLLD